MMPTISFFVQGIPKGQPRPRAFARKIGGKFVARVYDAGTAEAWKSNIAVNSKPYIPATPLELPLMVALRFYMPRPKSHFGKKGLKESAPQIFVHKPDCDNLAKAVLDALTQLGFWKDDCQITTLNIKKRYATYYAGTTGVSIEIKEDSES